MVIGVFEGFYVSVTFIVGLWAMFAVLTGRDITEGITEIYESLRKFVSRYGAKNVG